MRGQNTGLTELSIALNLCTTRDQWATTLDHFTTSPQTLVPFITTPEFLLEATTSTDPVRRQTSATVLTWHKPIDDSRLWNSMLHSPDREVVKRAADSIVANRRFDLFAAMLRVQPMTGTSSYSFPNYTDAEVRLLLQQNDPEVDKFCFLSISLAHRVHLIDWIVERLNERDTPHARNAIHDTLRGPDPFGIAGGDPWETTTLLPPTSVSDLRNRLDHGTRKRMGDPRDFLRAAKTLAHSGTKADWDFLHDVYVREVKNGISESYSSVLAKALGELEPARTRRFWVDELDADDHRRQTAALAAMGLIAAVEFVPAIEAFQTNPPKASPTNRYPADYIFKNHHYARILNYALHRCRGIHSWQLLAKDGRYYLSKEALSLREQSSDSAAL